MADYKARDENKRYFPEYYGFKSGMPAAVEYNTRSGWHGLGDKAKQVIRDRDAARRSRYATEDVRGAVATSNAQARAAARRRRLGMGTGMTVPEAKVALENPAAASMPELAMLKELLPLLAQYRQRR